MSATQGRTPPEQIEREAQQAQQLLDNPLLMQILAELDSDAIMTWRRSSGPEQREQAWHGMAAIQALAQRIKGRLETKKLAASKTRNR
jgi:hypothetical protein